MHPDHTPDLDYAISARSLRLAIDRWKEASDGIKKSMSRHVGTPNYDIVAEAGGMVCDAFQICIEDACSILNEKVPPMSSMKN